MIGDDANCLETVRKINKNLEKENAQLKENNAQLKENIRETVDYICSLTPRNSQTFKDLTYLEIVKALRILTNMEFNFNNYISNKDTLKTKIEKALSETKLPDSYPIYDPEQIAVQKLINIKEILEGNWQEGKTEREGK